MNGSTDQFEQRAAKRRRDVLRDLQLGRAIDEADYWLELVELQQEGKIEIKRGKWPRASSAIITLVKRISIDDVREAVQSIRELRKAAGNIEDCRREAEALERELYLTVLTEIARTRGRDDGFDPNVSENIADAADHMRRLADAALDRDDDGP